MLYFVIVFFNHSRNRWRTASGWSEWPWWNKINSKSNSNWWWTGCYNGRVGRCELTLKHHTCSISSFSRSPLMMWHRYSNGHSSCIPNTRPVEHKFTSLIRLPYFIHPPRIPGSPRSGRFCCSCWQIEHACLIYDKQWTEGAHPNHILSRRRPCARNVLSNHYRLRLR